MRNIIPMELTDLNSSISMKLRPTYGGLPEYGVSNFADIANFETNINYRLKRLIAEITPSVERSIVDFNGNVRKKANGLEAESVIGGGIHFKGQPRAAYANLTSYIPVSISAGTVVTFSKSASTSYTIDFIVEYSNGTAELFQLPSGTTTKTVTLSANVVSVQLNLNSLSTTQYYDETIYPKLKLGYSHPWVGGAGKNVIPTFSGTPTISGSGVTATVNADGSITLGGTATSTVTIDAPVSTWQWNGTDNYWLSGCPTGGDSANGYSLRIDGANNAYSNYDTGNGIKLANFSEQYSLSGQPLHFRIVIRSGTNVNGKTFKPMLNAGLSAQPYEPYSNICPIDGFDEVVVNVVGKNLYIGSPSFDGYVNRNAYTLASETYNGHEVIQRTGAWNGAYQNVSVQAGVTYTFSAMVKVNTTANISIYNVTNERLLLQSVSANTWTRLQATFTPSEDKIEHLRVETATNDVTIYLSEYQLEFGSTATAYEPYNGTTYTTDLDGTRYGGTLDVTTGVLTRTHGYVELGTLTWEKITNTTYGDYFRSAYGSVSAKTNSAVICSQYNSSTLWFIRNTNIDKAVGAEGGYVEIRDLLYTDATSFKNALAANNAQLVYELATPQTVQLTPQEVETVVGQNHIWANSGQVYVEYHFVEDFEE